MHREKRIQLLNFRTNWIDISVTFFLHRADLQRGFTLLELIVVLMLLGALSAVVVAAIPSGLLGSGPDLQRFEDRLVGDLRKARARAFGCGGGERTVTASLTGTGWSITPDCGGDGSLVADFEFPNPAAVELLNGGDFVFTYPFGRLVDDGTNTLVLSDKQGGESRRLCLHGITGTVSRGACE